MFYNILVFISILVGICIIIFSFKNFNNRKETLLEEDFDESDVAIIKKLEQAINEAENLVNEIYKISQNIFDEIDEKYKELLYIYNIIDEKEKTIFNNYKNFNSEIKDDLSNIDINTTKITSINEDDLNKIRANIDVNSSKNKNIINLYNDGFSIAEISKILGVGQGEIKLTLELRKDKI